MADDSMTFWECIGTAGEGIFLRNLMERCLERLMDPEVTNGIQVAARAVGSPP